ncbi:tyrosine-type recombinase/integrase [Shinella sp.]|uniref:tyrosine-type recombinase/integrase n=1 Tax=Shinella sp. TaxID=1870904 RepID=UPI0039E5FB12
MTRQRGNLWQADVRQGDGTRLRPTFRTESEAVQWEAEAREAIRQGKPLPPSVRPSRRTSERDLHLLGPLFDFVARTEWAGKRAEITLTANGRHVCEFFGRNKPVADITAADIAEMKLHFAEQGLAPATVNRKAAALSKMLSIAKDDGVIDAIPRIRWATEEKTRFRYIDEREERALLAYWEANGMHSMRELCVLLLDTGARCFTEMIAARWDAFGPGFRTVTFWHTKTNRPRTVPLTKRSQAIIGRLHRLKSHRTQGPFTGFKKSTMRNAWDTMREVLQMQDVTPHTLRHTCITRLILGGVDIKRVMEWAGHTNVATTMRYMQIRPSALSDVLHVLESSKAA